MKGEQAEEGALAQAGAAEQSKGKVADNSDMDQFMDKDFDETDSWIGWAADVYFRLFLYIFVKYSHWIATIWGIHSPLHRKSKDLEEYAKQFAKEEAENTSARQIRYELYPSKQYVLYLAKKNAIKTWTSDGPDGKNRGCLEVQIAIATEKIRNMILHMREFRKDYRCRSKLTSLVCARRRMLDKLASRNLDSYMKIREEFEDSPCLPYLGFAESVITVMVDFPNGKSTRIHQKYPEMGELMRISWE